MLNLESRICSNPKCSREFRVLESSTQSFCGRDCIDAASGVKRTRHQIWQDEARIGKNIALAKKGILQRPLKEEGLGLERGSKRSIGQIQKPGEHISERCMLPEALKDLESERKDTTKKTRSDSMPGDWNDLMPTGKKNIQEQGITTEKTENTSLDKSAEPEMLEFHLELSEDFADNLKKESLDSMSLLNKSANKLMDLMEESVSDSDVEKSKQGIHRVEAHRIMAAVECAKTIASTIQVQANIVKSVSALFKETMK